MGYQEVWGWATDMSFSLVLVNKKATLIPWREQTVSYVSIC